VENSPLEIIPIGPSELLPQGIKAIELKPEYKEMLVIIQNGAPAVNKATENFNKTQSQFMDNMMTVSHPTLLRNARQVCAELNKSKIALREAALLGAEKEVEIEIKQEKLSKETDPLKKKKLQVKIAQLQNQLTSMMPYVEAAIRKVTNYTIQFNSLVDNWKLRSGKDSFDEKDFEDQEEFYHIATAFNQGLTAALARPDLSIDEGNLIYMNQIGIHPLAAKLELQGFLQVQQKMFAEGLAPDHSFVLRFLGDMANKYQGSAKALLGNKGMTDKSDIALLKRSN